MRKVRQQVGFGDSCGRSPDAARRFQHDLAQLAKMRFSISMDRSCAVRILRSYSFSSGVVKRSALTSVCLRS